MFKYDAEGTGLTNAGIFGLPYTLEESQLVILPIPWEVTTSYRQGTAQGPAAILKASPQIELFDPFWGNFYEKGIYLFPEEPQLHQWNLDYRKEAQKVMTALETGQLPQQKWVDEVNQGSQKLNEWVYTRAKKLLNNNHQVAILGGDHSSPFGLVQAICEKYPQEIGLLQIDAHADLRRNYQGFEHSHASIMHNILSQLSIHSMVQVGVRDFCHEEYDYQRKQPHLHCYFDNSICNQLDRGKSWNHLCQEIIHKLPEKVYISFDIDGLDPSLCPNTGTPVPGGLGFWQVQSLLRELQHQGKQVIGFDLCETSMGKSLSEWDAIVGSRILYNLCAVTLSSKHSDLEKV